MDAERLYHRAMQDLWDGFGWLFTNAGLLVDVDVIYGVGSRCYDRAYRHWKARRHGR